MSRAFDPCFSLFISNISGVARRKPRSVSKNGDRNKLALGTNWLYAALLLKDFSIMGKSTLQLFLPLVIL